MEMATCTDSQLTSDLHEQKSMDTEEVCKENCAAKGDSCTNQLPVKQFSLNISPNFDDLMSDNDLQSVLYFSNKDQPKCDKALFENMFMAWKNQETCAGLNEKEISQTFDMTEKTKINTESKVGELEKTIKLLQKTVATLHTELNLIDTLEKDNTELKTTIKQLKINMELQKTETESITASYHNQVEEMRSKYEDERESIKCKTKLQIEENEKKLYKMCEDKQNELESMKRKIDKIEKDQQSKIDLLTVDFENKLAKMQRQQTVSTLNQQQTSSTNQEIFRKKLQHVKNGYENELKCLGEQVRNLQSQLTMSNEGQTQQIGQSGNGQIDIVSQVGRSNKFVAQSSKKQRIIQSGKDLYSKSPCSMHTAATKKMRKF